MTATATVVARRTTTKARSQSIDALRIANGKRSANATALTKLGRAEISLETVLDMECVSATPLMAVLSALPFRRQMAAKRVYSAASAEAIGQRAGLDLSRKAGSITCPRTKRKLLEVAYDVAGRTAWIFTSDPAPKLEPPRTWSAAATDAAREQRDAAREKANQVKARRAEIRRLLAAGTMTLEDALRDPSSETWELAKLLPHVALINPDTGEPSRHSAPGRVPRVLKLCGLRGSKKAGSLTDRQIALLVSVADRQFKTLGNKRRGRA